MAAATDAKPKLKIVEGGSKDAARPASLSLTDRADALAKGDLAASTRRAYSQGRSRFAAWCADHGHESLPASPETVRLYLTDHAETCRPATLSRRLVSICRAHKEAAHEPPTRSEAVRRQFHAICCQEGVSQAQKSAIAIEQLREVTGALPTTTLGVRDEALLLLGFAGAFRRSEIVALNTSDIQALPEELLVTLRRSKTDQTGKGRTIAIPQGVNADTCPVRAFQAWVKEGGIKSGTLLRVIDRHGNVSGRWLCDLSVARVMQRSLVWVGVDAAPYATHTCARTW